MAVASGLSITPDNIEDSPGGSSRRGSHRLAAAISCERLWWLRYGLGFRPKYEPDYRLTGTLVHLCLAFWYASKMDDPPSWYHTRSLEEEMEKEGIGRPDLIRLSYEIFEYYKHARAAEPWHPVAVEKEFEATLGELDPEGQPAKLNDQIVTCRVDLLAEINGELYIVDHKTQGDGWRRDGRLEKWKDDGDYLLNWQVMCNLHILRKRLTRPIEGFIINRIKRKAPFDHDHHILRVPRRAYEQAPRTARSMIARELWVRARAEHDMPPIPNFAACYGRYGPCDYRDVCAADTKEDGLVILGNRFNQKDDIYNGS